MDDYLANETLRSQSVTLLLIQFPANVIWTGMTVAGLLTSSFLLILTLIRRQLRTVAQTSVIALALSDLLQSIGFGLLGVKRLYLTSRGEPELNSKLGCMHWMFLMNLTLVSSCMILACSGIERILALATPVWFRSHRARLSACLLSAAVLLSVGVTLFGDLVATVDEPALACTSTGASPPSYGLLFAYVFNGGSCLVFLLNCAIAAMLYRRYRRAIVNRTVESFKRDMEVNALKSLAAISILFCVSGVGGGALGTIIRQSSLSDYSKSAVGPIAGCLHLVHIVFDCPIYVYFGTEYRLAARKLFARKLFARVYRLISPSSQTPAIVSLTKNSSRVGVANRIQIR